MIPDREKSKEELIAELQALREEIGQVAYLDRIYTSVFFYAGDMIFITELETNRILDVNPKAVNRLGYMRDELKQMTLMQLEVHGVSDGLPSSTGAMEASLGGTRVYECHIRRADEKLIPVEISSRGFRHEGQNLVVNFVRDIAGRKDAQAQLKESRDQLFLLRQLDNHLSRKLDVHNVLTVALDAAVPLSGAETGFIGLVDGGGLRISYALGGYAERIGTVLSLYDGAVGRVVRQHQAELIPDVALDPDYAGYISGTRAQMTVPLIASERLLGVLNLETAHPERFSENTFEFMRLLAAHAAVALANSEAYEYQMQLVEDLDAYAHTVAHDLKNPLQLMVGSASLLVMGFDDFPPDEMFEILQTIERSSMKMTNIIDELLVLASVRKMEDINVQPLAMGDIVDEALIRLNTMVADSEVDLIFPAEWPVTLGYAPWIEEVWENFISNAIKYGGDPPVVELGGELLDDGYAAFWVMDNGRGIGEADFATVFRPFTRLEQTPRAQGHGLGLSIVRRIVEKLGGEVYVESYPGEGSTFGFKLPAVNIDN